ncbi:GNAT family N-acetyltransferase [Martelella endophytica]|uniref:BioF2-like acetyltransferase domain-containing protein n=1 Tax=Martelella endophytica TaxID=1486262 RepID=A0A0D5LMM2_MAREN|nr:GNAT family N-acetyltransferase [Martelella endophytica]AJY45381.1 hypothetical protein TM49_06200 [Martelella endophytica]
MSIIRKDLGVRPPARLKSKLSVVRPGHAVPDVRLELKSGGEFSIYSHAPDELEKAMDRLAFQAIETNVFQTAPFFLPALRHSGGQLRLAVIEDATNAASEDNLAALMAFSVEGHGNQQGSHVVARALTRDGGGYHAPLVSRHRPMATLDQLFEALAGSLVNLPGVVVFPQLLADGPFMRAARAVAAARGLPFRVKATGRRRALTGRIDPTTALSEAERAAWQDYLGKWQALQTKGRLSYSVARNPAEISTALERLHQLSDLAEHESRLAATVPAARMLARRDWLRIHSLRQNDRLLAAAIQPVFRGEATIWQIFERPDMADHAIGEQLLVRLTEWNLADPNITVTRADAAAPAALAERFWPTEEGRATLAVAIRPGLERQLDSVVDADR